MRNAISILLIVILVVTTPVILLLTTVKYRVATSSFIKHELSTQDVYTIALEQIDQQILKVKFDENIPITGLDLETLAHQVLTPTWLQQNIESVLDNAFAWFNGPAGATLSLPIDLAQPKLALTQGVDSLLTQKIPALPVCPKKHSAKDLCRTTSTNLAQVKDILKNNDIDIATLETQLPDTVDLAHPVLPTLALGKNATTSSSQTLQEKVQPMLDKLNQAKTKYHQALQYFMYALAAYAVLILAYVAINIKGLRRLVRWLGILFVAITPIPLAISVASKPVMDKFIIPQIHFGSGTPAALSTAVPAIIRDLQHTLFGPIMITALALFVLGLGAIIGAHYIKSPAPTKK